MNFIVSIGSSAYVEYHFQVRQGTIHQLISCFKKVFVNSEVNSTTIFESKPTEPNQFLQDSW